MIVYLFRHLPKIFLVVDYIVINLFLYLYNFYFFEDQRSDLFNIDYKIQFVIVNFSWFIITQLTRLYKSNTLQESSLQFNALTKSCFLFIIFFLIYLFLVFSQNINYAKFSLYFIVVSFLMFTSRFILFLYRKKNRVAIGRKLYAFSTVIVGESNYSKLLMSDRRLRRSLGIRSSYTYDKDNCKEKNIGDINQLFSDLETVKINNIIFCDDKIDIDLYEKIVDIAEHKMIRIYMVPEFKNSHLGSYYVDVIHEMPFLKLIKEPLSNPKKQLLKRSFDILFSLFVIVFLLSWLMPIIALIIKLESKGPVFFLQKRSGLKNKPFDCVKFRSMAVNEIADLQIAKKNDSRITKFGAFMRKTSIDELPQFINVFLGDMSVVGPRPHMLSQTEQYSKITKKYMTRHIVKPGITGWAQVMGSRGEIFSDRDMERRIEKDIWYIQHWSFFLDLKIIFLTFYNIVKGDEQAY
ncbi:exopolysaccharide biosynthesis polyprenyl glycosylphosphotransferase [Epilithonimonas zeae]|uniref:Putative colanic acid biosysnthesis UDP-glucose lipid carrier transferase n=1 Tax=Epilithonimonas zeae TaxID=1416779 RepID=A0A1N6HEG7_9FLAO|nr:exopolysaccharide biosynthesis polyprenyl glycosylphosphotransferase [Epilithonimonas zeae]SIO18238.1 putative colanic acid biosysnthesis UDP-glucose lipid carrier transferase [Epilithonimonas zeae]